MKELHLSIVSPEKSIFDGNVKIVTLPGMIGSFSILPGHAPIVSSLKAGTLSYTTMDGEEHTMDIQGGFVEMSDGTVSACVPDGNSSPAQRLSIKKLKNEVIILQKNTVTW